MFIQSKHQYSITHLYIPPGEVDYSQVTACALDPVHTFYSVMVWVGVS